MFVARIERVLYRRRIYQISKSDKDIIAMLLKKMSIYQNKRSCSSLYERLNSIDKGNFGTVEDFANSAINDYANYPSFLQKIKRDYGLCRKDLVSILVDSFNNKL